MTYFTLVIFSYFLGCLSTIVILIGLYICFGLSSRGPVMKAEQYQTFHPIGENHHSKNSTVDTANYLLQFLFQELKDTAKVRRYVLKKLNHEIDDFKETKLGKLFLEDISILSFSLGKECPVFSDIQLDSQERDKRKLIKDVSTRLTFEYRDGFSATLDIKLRFGYKCQLYIKIKRVRGQIRLEFHREPYSHWLAVFQEEPIIDFELKSYFSSRESSQLAQIILQQIRRVIRRKLTWPSYKIRYEPFFLRSRRSAPIENPLIDKSLIPGIFEVELIDCDRLSIPFELFPRKNFLLFVTFSINERTYEDDFCLDRSRWTQKTIEFTPKTHRISVKDVLFMNRTEYLVEGFDILPDSVKNSDEFQGEFAERKVFLLQIDDKDIKNLRQINSYFYENNDKQIRISVGIPLLNCIQVHQELNLDEDDAPTTTNSKNASTAKLSLMVINKDSLARFQAEETAIKVLDTYVNFNSKVKKTFDVGENHYFLNICLWCEPPPQCTMMNIDQKRVLLGYTSAALSEIVFDAHMNFHRETQMTLNFQSVQFNNRVPSEKLNELSTHKGYDENLTHGFVTVNVKHQPREAEPLSDNEETDEFTSIDEDYEELPPTKLNDHIFTEQQFHRKTICGYCKKKIWMKTGFQCQNCFIPVHKKCAGKFSQHVMCTHQISIVDYENSLEESLLRDEKTTKPVRTSKIADVAYSTLRRFKPKQSITRSEARRSLESDISEADLHDIIDKCLSDEDLDAQSLDEFFRTKTLDQTEEYAKACQYGDRLFEGLTNDQRRAKIETEISRLKEEIDLQNQIRNETFIEYNSEPSDGNIKKKVKEKITNINEKIQALGSLALFYCSCLRCCNSDSECKFENSKNFDSD